MTQLASIGKEQKIIEFIVFCFFQHLHSLVMILAKAMPPPNSSTLAWRIPGMGEPGRLQSMGSHRVGHNWSNLAAAAAEWHCSSGGKNGPFSKQWCDNRFVTTFGEIRHRFEQNKVTLLLLLSPFSRIWLCVTPQTAVHQAPPSLGFSRQEHWIGLPFPSP